MKILFVDCCVRGAASRTKKIADAFLSAIDRSKCDVEKIDITGGELAPLTAESLAKRDAILAEKKYDDPMLAHARSFSAADAIVIAAPFWDLTFPALLKIYIENISVEGVTFAVDERGIHGLCRAREIMLITTRGGFYDGGELEQGGREIAALAKMYGIKKYRCISVEGTDVPTGDLEEKIIRAQEEARAAARDIAG